MSLAKAVKAEPLPDEEAIKRLAAAGLGAGLPALAEPVRTLVSSKELPPERRLRGVKRDTPESTNGVKFVWC